MSQKKHLAAVSDSVELTVTCTILGYCYHQEYNIIKREGVTYSSIVPCTAVVRVEARSMIFTIIIMWCNLSSVY